MTHTYDFWKRSLEGATPPIHEGDPQLGFYSRRLKHGEGIYTRVPVAIFIDPEEGLVAYQGCEGGAKQQDPVEIWSWIADKPITEEVFREVYETGKWPGEIGPGHNAPPAGDFEVLNEQIENAIKLAKSILEKGSIKTKADADKAAHARERLGQLSKKADENRAELRKPLNAELKAIQAKWLPLVDGPKKLSGKLGSILTEYLNAVEAKKAKAIAKTEEETGEKVETTSTKVGGAVSGRRQSLVTVTTAKITNFDKLHDALVVQGADCPYHDEWIALMQKHADRLARAGTKLSGMSIKTEKKVR